MLDQTADLQRDALAAAAPLPPDHPRVAHGRIGALLVNLGTPDATDYWSMRRYLSEFLSDRRVIDYSPWLWQPLLQLVILTKRPFSSGRNYRGIWNTERNESPLRTITRAQTERLRDAMAARWGDRVRVDFCMRYGNPSTESVIRRMQAAGCDRIVLFPLYPQYAGATTATACDQAFRTLMKLRWQPAIRTVPPYHDHPLYIEALADSVERSLAGLARRPEVLVASFHGMPRRYLEEGDPYHCHCMKTARLLRERLGLGPKELAVTFQSRFGSEEWLQPYTVEEVARLAAEGRKRIAVIAPAFAADCVETLEEINGEIRESFLHAGGEEFTYIPCLNDDPAHVAMIGAILEREMQGWL